MTSTNPKNVIHEIFEGTDTLSGLKAAVAGTGKPAASAYLGQRKELNKESPVLLVMFGGIDRKFAGVGTKLYENSTTIELQYMVYNGAEDNPLAEDEREDAMADIETAVAQWFADHQKGTHYRSVIYPVEKTQPLPLKHIDGNPYLIMSAYAVAETRDVT